MKGLIPLLVIMLLLGGCKIKAPEATPKLWNNTNPISDYDVYESPTLFDSEGNTWQGSRLGNGPSLRKIDTNGDELWNTALSASAKAILETETGAVILLGNLAVVSISDGGAIVWQQPTGLGPTLVASLQVSSEGRILVTAEGKTTIGLAALSSDGVLLWTQSIATDDDYYYSALVERSDGNFLFIGSTTSRDYVTAILSATGSLISQSSYTGDIALQRVEVSGTHILVVGNSGVMAVNSDGVPVWSFKEGEDQSMVCGTLRDSGIVCGYQDIDSENSSLKWLDVDGAVVRSQAFPLVEIKHVSQTDDGRVLVHSLYMPPISDFVKFALDLKISLINYAEEKLHVLDSDWNETHTLALPPILLNSMKFYSDIYMWVVGGYPYQYAIHSAIWQDLVLVSGGVENYKYNNGDSYYVDYRQAWAYLLE